MHAIAIIMILASGAYASNLPAKSDAFDQKALNSRGRKWSNQAISFEQDLQKVQKAQEQQAAGKITPVNYKQFTLQITANLDAALARPESGLDPAVQNSAARLLTALGDLPQAKGCAEKAMALAPTDPRPVLTGGIIAYQMRDYAAAAKAAAQALRLDPGDKAAYALWQLSRSRGAAPAAPEAGAGADILAMSSPLDHPELSAWGRRSLDRQAAVKALNEAAGRFKLAAYQDALEQTRIAAERDPSLPDIYMQRALLFMSMKEPAQAEPELAKAILLWSLDEGGDKRALAAAYAARAALRLDRKDFQAAAHDAEAALRDNPKSAAAYYYRGAARAALGADPALVLGDYKEAAVLSPQDYSGIYEAALAQYDKSARSGLARAGSCPVAGKAGILLGSALLVFALGAFTASRLRRK